MVGRTRRDGIIKTDWFQPHRVFFKAEVKRNRHLSIKSTGCKHVKHMTSHHNRLLLTGPKNLIHKEIRSYVWSLWLRILN